MNKIRIKEKYIKIAFILLIFVVTLTWAIIQPNNEGPDEGMKMDICKYIANHGRLPHGGEEEIRNPIWGISYGFTPILSYIIGGLFVKIASNFTSDIHILYIAARLVSVICITLMSIVNMKIGEKLFKNKYYKWFFIVLTSALPQIIFIGSYINNDSLALLSISIIIYAWLNGLESKWNIKSCITLSIGLGLCALSYYNAYGYILTSVILFITSYFINKGENNKFDFKDMFKKGIIITGITFLLCGWWFIRSAIIYNGDFLGLSTEEEYSEQYAMEEFKPTNRKTPQNTNMGLFNMLFNKGWVIVTLKSFVGLFGTMIITMGTKFYLLYFGVFAIGIIGYISRFYKLKHIKELKEDKNKALLEVIFGINIVIPISLSIYYSYCNDFQPQGRYIMPMLIPFVYFIVSGLEKILDKFIKNEKIKKVVQILIIAIGILLPIHCLIRMIQKY